jgi:hypothetical protein
MRYRFLPFAAGAIASIVALTAPCHDAHACGGGTLYPTEAQAISGAVDGHRIVLSLSTTQTVLWDQITYKGDPKDFAWVMPVPAGSSLELASDAWLEALDTVTATRISGPALDCPEEEQGGCFGSVAGGETGGEPGSRSFGSKQAGSDVEILDHRAVGPYDTVTIKSETPGAISQWLTDNGYKIPAAVQPILDDYAGKGMNFIALRLRPDDGGVTHMRSVRVTMPGGITTFPMRMLSVGAKEKVALELIVLSEGRVEVSGFPSVELNLKGLVWDFEAETSNYATLRANALSVAGDNAWLTTYARRGALLSPRTFDGLSAWDGEPRASVADLYFEVRVVNGELDPGCSLDPSLGSSSAKVVDVCAKDPLCPAPAAGELDARTFGCGNLKDLSVALTGLHPKDVWVSRFEANLPREALNADLTFNPRMTQDPVENEFTAPKANNIPDECTLAGAAIPGKPSSPAQPTSPRGRMTIVLTALAAAAIVLRRARRLGPALAPLRAA